MHVDERHAAAAYTYAWWLTGEDDAAVAALEAAMAVVAAAAEGDDPPAVALARAVRAELRDLQTMHGPSQLALLHDGLDLPLDASADIAGVAPDEIGFGLAHGRMEALLETVRDPFDHPEFLGGLAVDDPQTLAHARTCPSCARARTLIERGRTELRAVAPVSAPPGLLARLVAEFAPAVVEEAAPPVVEEPPVVVEESPVVVEESPVVVEEPAVVVEEPPPVVEEPPVVVEEPPVVVEAAPPVVEEPPVVVEESPVVVEEPPVVVEEAAPPVVEEPPVLEDAPVLEDEAAEDAIAVHEILEAPQPYAAAGDDVLAPDVIDLTEAPPDIDAPMVEAPPADATVEDTVLAPAAPPDIDAPPVIVPPEAPPELIPTTPARKRTAGVLAGAGLLTACVLVVWFVASGGDDTLPGDLGQPDEQITPTPEVSPSPQAGPRPEDRKEFEVLSAGLLLSGEEDISRRGIEIRREDAIRVAVDYANATDGIRLDALWRVNGKPYQRLTTVVSSKASRHVWGLPLPADGWPIGSHRIVLTANDSVAGSIDFAVRDTAL